MGLNRCLETPGINSCLCENSPGEAILLKQGQKQMFCFKLLMSGLLSQLLSCDDASPGFFRELFRRRLHINECLVAPTVWGFVYR